jgi:LmbE family N-acetylglucosaminyl deacetylase
MAYIPLPDSEIERVLVVNAHPDDADFGAGATIAYWSSLGIEVHYLLFTNGDQGGFDDTPRDQMGPLRQSEQRAAGGILGVKSFTFLGHRDGHLVPSIEKRGEVVKAIREIRPQRMLIQSPERNWERIYGSHPDHLAAGEIATQAVYPDARNEFAFPELLKAGLQPWTVDEVWLMAHPVRTHYIDTTEFIDQKISALKAHKSQTSHMDLDEIIRNWGGFIAQEAGFAEGRTAEGFFTVGTR